MTDIHLRPVRVALDETTRRLAAPGIKSTCWNAASSPGYVLICTFAATSETQVRQDGPLGEGQAGLSSSPLTAHVRVRWPHAHMRGLPGHTTFDLNQRKR